MSTDENIKPRHPGSYCSPAGETGEFATGRKAVCSSRNPGDRARWRAAEPPLPKTGRRRPAPAAPLIVIPDERLLELAAAPPPPATWEELGSPQGPPPVGQVIGHLGGTYERLPGEPRRYRVIAADGRDISDTVRGAIGHSQTAEDARTALRMDDWQESRSAEDRNSEWRKTLGEVTGSWNYSTGEVDGFDAATPADRVAIREALKNWTGNKGKTVTGGATRVAEPRVNAVIRGAIPLDAAATADMRAMDLAFTMSKTKKAITLYRGYSDGSHILPADWLDRPLVGLEWTNGGYTPGSAEQETSEFYIGEVKDRGFGVRLNLPEGFPAIAIPDEIGGIDNEAEIVLPRELKFRVVGDAGAQGRYGMRWLDVEVVPT